MICEDCLDNEIERDEEGFYYADPEYAKGEVEFEGVREAAQRLVNALENAGYFEKDTDANKTPEQPAEELAYLSGRLAGLSGTVRYEIPEELRQELKGISGSLDKYRGR